MPIRPWEDVPYLPTLLLRPAEMRALEELPDQTKDAMLPMIPLRPWLGANLLRNSHDRIALSYGERPVIVGVGEPEPPKDRPVFGELDDLRSPEGGYDNWCGYVDDHPWIIPVAQLGREVAEEALQIERLHQFDRGLVVVVERDTFGALHLIAERVAARTEGGRGVCFILDFCRAGRDHLQVAAVTAGYIRTVRARCPHAFISISASSFPSSFDGLRQQEIYERLLFNEVAGNLGQAGLIYGDRGSARAEALSGGSGVIPARIDYPGFDDWFFYRSTSTGFDGYVEQAEILIDEDRWDGDLRIWGTQMIERTARRDPAAIDTPGKATATRINLHLQLQTFYGRPIDQQSTEDDWDD